MTVESKLWVSRHDISTLLVDRMHHANMSIKTLAEAASCDRKTIRKILDGTSGPWVLDRTAEQILKPLDAAERLADLDTFRSA